MSDEILLGWVCLGIFGLYLFAVFCLVRWMQELGKSIKGGQDGAIM